MPRPRKCRRVCRLPENPGFDPINRAAEETAVILSVDEYETIRLIDNEDFSQEQCGEYMHIARTTVQQIYTQARQKLAKALVEGLPLRIRGGTYMLCDGQDAHCGCGGCARHRCQEPQNTKEARPMKIAIPLDENRVDVCPVLSRAPYFLFRTEQGTEILPNPAAEAEGGAGLKAAQFLLDQQITMLITPRCGENAGDVFNAAEIRIYKSEGKTAEENLRAFEAGSLQVLTHFHGGFHGIQ